LGGINALISGLNKIQIKIIDQTGKQTHDLLEIKAKGKA